MKIMSGIFGSPNRRIAVIAVLVLGLDQITKHVLLKHLDYSGERIVIEGFFKFVHWGNTGAAWSLFRGNNEMLAIVALLALLALFLTRHHFDSDKLAGQIGFGLIFGGIVGNLVDRLRVGHVIDFIYFYLHSPSGREIGFPAFNVADSAICIGVGLIFLITWNSERENKRSASVAAAGDTLSQPSANANAGSQPGITEGRLNE